jgi:uncharacterized MAPEG superfamily protein
MNIAYSCVLLAAIMPYFFAAYAKFSTKGFDNSRPREFLDQLQGMPKRAHYVQLNSFEAFGAFATGVIIAHLAGVAQWPINVFAVSFIIFRILYGVCYIFDKPTWRSLVFFGGFVCVLGLFITAILKS